MKKINIGLVQMKCTSNKEENINRSIYKIREISQKGAKIICLQEFFSLLYFCNIEHYDNFSFSESIPGNTTNQFMKLAKELGIVLIISIFEKRTEGIYHNTIAVIDADGTYLGKYRKMHIPNDPSYYEKFYFTPGDLGYQVFKTQYAKIGVLICWDQWYPEAARIITLMGAEILFCLASIGWASSQSKIMNIEQYYAWQTIQRSHAIANGIPIASVNRVGEEQKGYMKFWGGSFITNSFGSILYQASHDNEENIIQEIDLSEINKQRLHWPFLRDRRIDSYQLINRLFID